MNAQQAPTLGPPPAADLIAEHRRVWQRKPGLRAVYSHWFRSVHERCGPGSIVEIGCGPGFFKETFPDVIATDVVATPYAEHIVDAAALPFADGAVGNLVLIDVFHHIPEPARFLREAERVLARGGRLVMIEPWVGRAGTVLWRFLHHEHFDPAVDPARPWGGADKDPMTGNTALPYLYFRPGGYVERLGLDLRVVERRPFAGLPWILTLGFQPRTLLPGALAGAAEAVDRFLSRAPAWTATRCLLTIECAR